MSENDTIGTRLAEAREEQGLSIDDVARHSGVKSATLKNWETGKTVPRASKLHMLAGVLGVPLTWLMEGGSADLPTPSRLSRLERLEQKVERMHALQAELVELTAEIADELAEVRRIDEELEELAA